MSTQLFGNKIGITQSLITYLISPSNSIESVMSVNNVIRRVHQTGPVTVDIDDRNFLLIPTKTSLYVNDILIKVDPNHADVHNAIAKWKEINDH
jgi:hypothetical protein